MVHPHLYLRSLVQYFGAAGGLAAPYKGPTDAVLSNLCECRRCLQITAVRV